MPRTTNYTRAWIADYSPYLMFGTNAQYNSMTGGVGPSLLSTNIFTFKTQIAFRVMAPRSPINSTVPWLFKETIYYGPDQSDTSLEFWRLFSDSIVEWKVNDDVTLVGEYQVGTQEMAIPGNPRFVYMGAAFPMRWHISGPWSVALRPEVYWDPNGLQTGAEQFVRAVTTTGEYKFPYKWTNMIGRLEYRYDESTGSGGGFFKGNEIAPGHLPHAGPAHDNSCPDLDLGLTITVFQPVSSSSWFLHRFYFLCATCEHQTNPSVSESLAVP